MPENQYNSERRNRSQDYDTQRERVDFGRESRNSRDYVSERGSPDGFVSSNPGHFYPVWNAQKQTQAVSEGVEGMGNSTYFIKEANEGGSAMNCVNPWGYGLGFGGYGYGGNCNEGLAELIVSNNVADGTRDTIQAIGDAKGDIIGNQRQAELITLDAINRNGSDTRFAVERNGGDTRTAIERNSYETRDLVRQGDTANALGICGVQRQIGEVKYELSRQLADCCCELKEMMAAQELDRTRTELSDAKAKIAVLQNNQDILAAIKALLPAGVLK